MDSCEILTEKMASVADSKIQQSYIGRQASCLIMFAKLGTEDPNSDLRKGSHGLFDLTYIN